jgi:phosphoribosylaminoimidazole carboxylase PurE protein
MKKPVGIVIGSESDLPVIEETTKILDFFKIGYELTISSAHRSPKRTIDYAQNAKKKGFKVLIVGAGAAAHLAGIIAAETTLPVIGIPINSSPLQGIDSLLSTVQMPGGVPVAAMAVGKAGARNAGIFAAQILSIKDPKVGEKMRLYKKKLAKEVEIKANNLKNRKAK